MLRPFTLAGFAAAALLVPGAALADPPPGHGPGTHGPGVHGKHLAKGHAKPHKIVAKGTVVSVDATAGTVTVHVTRANHWGHALVGQDVAFSIPAGGVRAADRDNNGTVDLADVLANDKVLVQTTKLAADAAQPLAARKLVDQTSPEADDTDAEDAPAPAPTTPTS